MNCDILKVSLRPQKCITVTCDNTPLISEVTFGLAPKGDSSLAKVAYTGEFSDLAQKTSEVIVLNGGGAE